jgi:hypothetical protein
MFQNTFIRIIRAWQQRNKLVAFFIRSHGKHTETSILLDNTGSAYQIVVHASGLYFSPQITISEYLPDTKRTLHQKSFVSWLFRLRTDLERALIQIHQWMDENNSERLSQEEEMNLIKKMYKNIN